MDRYPNTAGFKARETSRAAAVEVEPRAKVLRERVLDLISRQDLTADECAAKLNESILAVRPRLTENAKKGLIRDTGRRRRNASGKAAIVWGPSKEQGSLF